MGHSVGFVPTMGALHEGHLSLVKRAKKENDLAVISIFVNPIQFNNPADLEKYPRNLERDLDLLRPLLNENDLVFAPCVEEMYPEADDRTFAFGEMESVMEGQFRPGHFNGVAIVVDLLFSIVGQCRSYFGEKDFQQLAIIRRLVAGERHPVEVVACETIREADGLAMSSRNVRIPAALRPSAGVIYKALQQAATEAGKRPPQEILRDITRMINNTPGFSTEYALLADEKSLAPIEKWGDSDQIRCFIAAYAGEVRLIDNLPL